MKRILFANKFEKFKNGTVYIHLDYINKTNNNFDLQDLKKIININYDEWLNEAKNFHNEISEYYSSLNNNWWLTDSSRFILWKTKQNYSLNNYFYAKAIVEFSKNHNEVIVVGDSKIIQIYINSLSNKKSSFSSSLNLMSLLVTLKISIITIFKAIEYLIILIKKSKSKIPEKNYVMVSSLALNYKIIKEKKDHFFSNLFEFDKYLWVYNDYPDKLSYIKEIINMEKKIFLFALELGSIRLIIKSLFSFWIFQYQIFFKKNIFIKKKKMSAFWLVFYNEFFLKKILHENIFYEIYLSSIYSKIFKIFSINKIILPYEESSWQRSILIPAKKKNIKSFGYAHASHSQGHKYFFSIDKKINPVRPNKILVTGKNALLKFIDMNYKPEDLIILGSGKYHEKKEINNFNIYDKKNILFMCGMGFEMVNFAKLINNNENFFMKYNLVIRENPHSWAEEHLLAKKILKRKNIPYQISNKDFKDEIIQSKYIVYETSTAGLEGILMGRIGIQINITDNIYSSAFHNIKDNKIKYCMNMKEFSELIIYYETLNKKLYSSLVDEQIQQVSTLIEKKNVSAIDLIKSF